MCVNEKRLQFLFILFYISNYLYLASAFFFYVYSYILTCMGVNTISGAYTVFGLCFQILIIFFASIRAIAILGWIWETEIFYYISC